VVISYNGKVWKQIALSGDRLSAEFREQATVSGSGWFSLGVEGPAGEGADGAFLQAATNAIRVYAGSKKIRNRASAEYFVRWIDKLQPIVAKTIGWRSQQEKDKVFAQLSEARHAYEQPKRRATDYPNGRFIRSLHHAIREKVRNDPPGGAVRALVFVGSIKGPNDGGSRCRSEISLRPISRFALLSTLSIVDTFTGVHVRFMDGLGGGLHPVSAVLPEIFETCAELAATEGHDRIGTMLGPVHSASL
jgi:hypothetical protein